MTPERPCECSFCREHPTLSDQLYRRGLDGCATRAVVLLVTLWWIARAAVLALALWWVA